MKINNKVALVAATALTAVGVGFGMAAHAVEAPTVVNKPVYKADFIAGLSDTRGTGYYGFGPKGLVVRTDGATSTDKVAEYYPTSDTTLPDTGSQEWTGSSPQAGKQIVFNSGVEGDTGYNILVGEPVYGDDWWMSTGSYIYKNHHDLCPLTTGGSGSDCHGTLAQWKAAFDKADPSAYGFSLGSGVKGDGTLVAQTFGSTRYVFTEGSAPVVTTPAPEVTTPAVTPTFTAKKRGHGIVFHFTGHQWIVKVNGKPRFVGSDSAGAAVVKYRYNVPNPGHVRRVALFLNGAKISQYKVR